MKFLIDANLPKELFEYYSDCIHATEIAQNASDSLIWNYAKDSNLTIVTKDFDFSDRMIGLLPPPRIIHFRTGNLRKQDLKKLLEDKWLSIQQLSSLYKLVLIFKTKAEGVD